MAKVGPLIAPVLAAGLFLLAGCETGIDAPAGWSQAGRQSRPLPGVSVADAFQAAKEELRDNFKLNIADANAFTHTIVCEPQFLARGDATAASQFRIISTRSDLQRRVEVRIVEDGPSVRAEVSAALQRRDTEQVRSLQAMRVAADAPSAAPLSTDAGVSPDRREIWTPIGRDNTLESEILAAIERHFAPAAATQPVGK